jgi:hypothetical protein
MVSRDLTGFDCASGGVAEVTFDDRATGDPRFAAGERERTNGLREEMAQAAMTAGADLPREVQFRLCLPAAK